VDVNVGAGDPVHPGVGTLVVGIFDFLSQNHIGPHLLRVDCRLMHNT
jgi:hypothetical protein